MTRHAIVNYGSLFQSYATQSILEGMGYNAQIIDYISHNETVTRRLRAFSLRCANPIKRIVYRLVKLPDEIIKDRKFVKFRKRLLKMTERFSSLEELKSHDFADDILCAGSDQLWGYMPNEAIDPAYFLEFGSEKNQYVAFSSSFGRVDFPPEYFENLDALLNKFSLLTIREPSGVDLIHKHTPYRAKHVFDPTLLFPREKWLEMAAAPVYRKPYILLYQLRKNKLMDGYVQALSKKTGLPIVRVSTSVYDFLKYGKKQVLKSPETVLSLFRDAHCVVTDSFHATVLSLIFNRRFVDFLPPATHERITDLLSVAGLSDRVVSEITEQTLAIPEIDIDYDGINATFDALRKEQLAYIQEQLEGME